MINVKTSGYNWESNPSGLYPPPVFGYLRCSVGIYLLEALDWPGQSLKRGGFLMAFLPPHAPGLRAFMVKPAIVHGLPRVHCAH